MRLVGLALAEYNALGNVQCLGVAPWGVVHGREEMVGARDDVIDLDLILVWGRQRRIITGADILGRLLRGIAGPGSVGPDALPT